MAAGAVVVLTIFLIKADMFSSADTKGKKIPAPGEAKLDQWRVRNTVTYETGRTFRNY